MDHITSVLFLGKQEVDLLLTWEDVVSAVEEAFRSDGRGEMLIPSKEIMPMGNGNAIFAMPGCLRDLGVSGVKWTNFYPNGAPGIPTLWGPILILSAVETGQPFAILDATTITNRRTSGGHAVVAAKYLAKKGANTLGVIGCGAQGRAAIQSFDRQFPLKEIFLYSATSKSAQDCAETLQSSVKAKLTVVTDPQIAAGSDMVLTATTSRTPVIREEWLSPGCFVAAMFGFHDLDPAFSFTADRWILGHRESDRMEILENPEYGAKLNPAGPHATLGEVICGKAPGRESEAQRIVFSHMGMGSLDIAVGSRVVEKARKQGVGQKLRLT